MSASDLRSGAKFDRRPQCIACELAEQTPLSPRHHARIGRPNARTSRLARFVPLPVAVSQISAVQFRKATANSDAIRMMSIQYNEVLLSQARITAACNVMHVVEARFCRWLLQSADRAESDTLELTQEFLAERSTHSGTIRSA
jgi:hypothetical protein